MNIAFFFIVKIKPHFHLSTQEMEPTLIFSRTVNFFERNYFHGPFQAFHCEGHKFISYAIMCYPRKIKSLLLLL